MSRYLPLIDMINNHIIGPNNFLHASEWHKHIEFSEALEKQITKSSSRSGNNLSDSQIENKKHQIFKKMSSFSTEELSLLSLHWNANFTGEDNANKSLSDSTFSKLRQIMKGKDVNCSVNSMYSAEICHDIHRFESNSRQNIPNLTLDDGSYLSLDSSLIDLMTRTVVNPSTESPSSEQVTSEKSLFENNPLISEEIDCDVYFNEDKGEFVLAKFTSPDNDDNINASRIALQIDALKLNKILEESEKLIPGSTKNKKIGSAIICEIDDDLEFEYEDISLLNGYSPTIIEKIDDIQKLTSSINILEIADKYFDKEISVFGPVEPENQQEIISKQPLFENTRNPSFEPSKFIPNKTIDYDESFDDHLPI